MTVTRFFIRTAVVSIVTAIIGAIFLFVVPKYRELAHLRKTRDDMESEKVALQFRISEIRSQQERFATDPGFVRKIAHQNRRLRPNEIMFVVAPPETPEP